MPHGHGHPRNCTCGFCRKSHMYTKRKRASTGRRRRRRRGRK